MKGSLKKVDFHTPVVSTPLLQWNHLQRDVETPVVSPCLSQEKLLLEHSGEVREKTVLLGRVPNRDW